MCMVYMSGMYDVRSTTYAVRCTAFKMYTIYIMYYVMAYTIHLCCMAHSIHVTSVQHRRINYFAAHVYGMMQEVFPN
jgi:hypothetical protein